MVWMLHTADMDKGVKKKNNNKHSIYTSNAAIQRWTTKKHNTATLGKVKLIILKVENGL